MSEFFTQSELAERLVQKTGVSLETAKKFSSCFFSIIKKGLKTNDRFFVYNFGTFKKTWIETTQGFNPSTGEKIEIPAHWRIKFIPCSALAKRLNRPYEKLKPKVINEKVSDNGLLARASKIRSDNENAYSTYPLPPVDEDVKSQENNDDFIDTDDDDDVYDGNERKGLLKYIAIAAVSALLFIVLLALLLKSCTSSKRNGSGKEKGRQTANDTVVESKKEEPSAEDEIKDDQEEDAQKETSETEEDGENDGDVNEDEKEKIPEESVEEAEKEEDDEKTASEIAEEKSSEEPVAPPMEPVEKDEYDEKAVSDLFEFYTVPSGLCYYSIAEKKLGNRHLWPLLYSANKSISVDPDLISVNAKIKIPDLNGKSAFDYAQTDSGRDAIFAAALDSYNGYLLMIEKEPDSSKNDERRRRAVGAIVSGEVLCPGFIEAKQSRIMPEYAQLAKNIVEHQYK